MLDNKIIRFYNQNKEMIWRIIIIVAFVIIIIRLANYFAGLSLKKDAERAANSSNATSEQLQTQSVISDTGISTTVAKSNSDVIDEFVKYCNEGNVEEAYNLLTDDCKEALYNTIDKFKAEYYDIIFTGEKLYTKEIWYSKDSTVTYRVDYTNNLLADGGKKAGQSFADYITVARNSDDTYRLNIGQFIIKEELNKKYEDDDILIEVLSKQIFRTYELYRIQFTNKKESENNIYDLEQTKWYIADRNEKTYALSFDEIARNYFILKPMGQNKLDTKYIKTYNPNKTTQKIVFEKLRINDEYKDIVIGL